MHSRELFWSLAYVAGKMTAVLHYQLVSHVYAECVR